MPEYLFIGGPLAGWQHVSQPSWKVWYPVPADPPRGPTSTFAPEGDIGTYTRRQFWHPSWRVVLTVFTCDEEMPGSSPVFPIGTVLPGIIYGRKLESAKTDRARIGR
jgi:hypothetical protein